MTDFSTSKKDFEYVERYEEREIERGETNGKEYLTTFSELRGLRNQYEFFHYNGKNKLNFVSN